MPMLLVIVVIMGCLSIDVITPIPAYADTTTTATTDAYQLYDTRERTEQVSVNKVWDDGLTNDTRKYGNADYANLLGITIQTGVPQTTLRTYTITYDANGGTYGIDNDGNAIITNTITYNAKNQPTNGTYATPERTDGYSLIGWSTSKTATTADSNITLTNTLTDSWMNARADGSNTTLYAVWKDIHINYAVMAYGIGIDKDASVNGNAMGITFGPALGYPEFSKYNNYWKPDSSSTQTFMKSHSVSGDATVMNENEPACADTSHSVITGTDAGTDVAGNAYRCLHYDNWNTIIYWNEHDPNVYDKCIPNHCSKAVVIMPNTRTIENGIFDADMRDSDRGLVGDGKSYIVKSKWDNSRSGVDIRQSGQGYAASLIRAKLVGADSHTKLDDNYAGVDALTRFSTDSSILSCFPSVLRDAIGSKALSGVSAASSGSGMSYDETSNGDVYDKLWLFSWGEMTSTVYPSAGFSSSTSSEAKRSSESRLWLRSPGSSNDACYLDSDGYLSNGGNSVHYGNSVAPGFTLTGSNDLTTNHLQIAGNEPAH